MKARLRLAAGTSLNQVASELGVWPTSLQLWMKDEPGATLQVVRVAEPDATSAAGADTVTLVTPDGFRFEGVPLAQAKALWEHLR